MKNKSFFKTKRMRTLIKQYRINEKKRMKDDGVWRRPQNKLCSECDPMNCICADNERKRELIDLYYERNKNIF